MRPPQAEKFRSKAQKGDTWRSPPQWCRYLFQLGTIRAIQLEYSEARDCLQQVGARRLCVGGSARVERGVSGV